MSKVDFKRINKAFVKSMRAIAVDLECPESEITKAQFTANNAENLTEWDIRKSGGFEAMKKLNFRPETNLESKYGARLVTQEINKIERAHGQSLFYEKALYEAVKATLGATPPKLHPKLPKLKRPARKAKRTIVAAISDTHFGSNISKEEMHGLNEFNWTIAARRMAHYVEQVAHYKLDHRKESDLVIQLNGDIIGGMIHNTEWFVDQLTTQFAGTVHLLSQALTYLAGHFGKVTVVCTPGNHGRNTAKMEKGRATTHKWDAFETMIYLSLKLSLKGYANVKFVIPESPFAIYKVQGHNVFQTHGDTVLNVGNPGNSLNMNGISNQINQITSSSLVPDGERIDIISVGHVHTPTVQLLNNLGVLVINGCLSGTDPFAQSIGIHSNNPTQMMFESTEKNAVGDIRMIQVKCADKEERLDKIIEPFTGKF